MVGTVEELSVGLESGWVRIREDGAYEVTKLFVWSDLVFDYTPADRVRHSMWISLLRDALSRGLTVSVTESDDTPLHIERVSLRG